MLRIHPFEIHISAHFSYFTINDRSHTNIILHLFSYCFIILTGEVNAYYIICWSFPGSQAKFNWAFQVTKCNGKANKNAYLGTAKYHWWANRKPVLSARGNILNSKVVFYNKTTCLLSRRCFSRDLWVVTPV